MESGSDEMERGRGVREWGGLMEDGKDKNEEGVYGSIPTNRHHVFPHNHIGGHIWKRRSRLPSHGTTSTPRSEPIQNTSTPLQQESRSKSSLTNAYLKRR